MKLSLIAKMLLANPLYRLKKTRVSLQLKGKNDFFILMHHRIIKKNASETFPQGGMYVEPETFGKQIQFLKDNFPIIPLEEVPRILGSGNKFGKNHPFCVLTFDDGWKDFFENAYPVLKSKNVCATVFLPTDIIGTRKQFWADNLAHILSKIEKSEKYSRNRSSSSNHIIVEKIENLKGSIEQKIETAAKELKKIPNEEIDRILKELKDKWEIDPMTEGRSFLTWEEAREMYKSGIICFGSHTKNHTILSTVSEDVIREELVQSKNKLVVENVVSPSFIPFAYPNGNYTRRIAEMVEQSGYSLALTTDKGWNRATDDKGELFRLKRIGIHQDIASTDSMLACRIYGIY